MSAQYRFSLIYVLGLLTLAVGAIVIVLACLAMAGWIFGAGVFDPQVSNSNQSGLMLGIAAGITPDAALCFILCGVSLWVLRESAGKAPPAKPPAEKFLPTEKFLVEAALMRSSLVKIPDEGSEAAWDENNSDGAKSGSLEEKSFTRRFARRAAQFCASGAAAIAVIALAGYALNWDAWAAFGQWIRPELAPARMAPGAALVFLFNGIALATLDVETSRGTRPAQYLSLAAFFLSLVAALGQAYQTSLPPSLSNSLFAAWG